MEEFMKFFTKTGKKKSPEQIAELKETDEAGQKRAPLQSSDVELIPNKKYRLTRQMYLFPEQAVISEINDFLKIGAVVTYLKSGESVEDNSMLWVYVRSEKQNKPDMGKGQEGWCFSRYLQPVEDDEARV
jgi:hypothetical protein